MMKMNIYIGPWKDDYTNSIKNTMNVLLWLFLQLITKKSVMELKQKKISALVLKESTESFSSGVLSNKKMRLIG